MFGAIAEINLKMDVPVYIPESINL